MKHISAWIILKFKYSELFLNNSLVEKKPKKKKVERNGCILKDNTTLLVALVPEYLLF